MNRPEFNSAGLPQSVRAAAERKAARSWCYVSPDGCTFYVSQSQAKAMQASDGGEVFPPMGQS